MEDVTSQVSEGEFRVKNDTLCLHILCWYFLLFFIKKMCHFIIFISFFDEVSIFCNRLLTNQKLELVIRNCQWNYAYWYQLLCTHNSYFYDIKWINHCYQKFTLHSRSIYSVSRYLFYLFCPYLLHIETRHLICFTVFYIKCNTRLKWVKILMIHFRLWSQKWD